MEKTCDTTSWRMQGLTDSWERDRRESLNHFSTNRFGAVSMDRYAYGCQDAVYPMAIKVQVDIPEATLVVPI